MNTDSRIRLTIVSALALMLALVTPPYMPYSLAEGAVSPTAPPAPPPIALGGQVTILRNQFYAPKEKDPVATKPFTVTEVQALAAAAKRLVKNGNQLLVQTKKKGAMPIEQFVSQLNQYEAF